MSRWAKNSCKDLLEAGKTLPPPPWVFSRGLSLGHQKWSILYTWKYFCLMKNEFVYIFLEARFQNALNQEDNIYFVSLRLLQLGNIAKIRLELAQISSDLYAEVFNSHKDFFWLNQSMYTANVLSAKSTDECLRTKSQDN